jgi:ribosomal protein S18 acetylase RimI-like enzyme
VEVEIRRLGPGDDEAVRAAADLFDKPPEAEATQRFLGEPSHHLLMAFSGGSPVGFVSGVELTHPDKGTEMFLYELSVDPAARRRGVGRQLVKTLAELARNRGNYGMWVLADDDNEAARATYARAGGREASRPLMIEWTFAALPPL